MLQLVDEEFSVFLLLDQALGDFALMCRDRAVMLDAPDRHAAHRPVDQKQHDARGVRPCIAEIDGNAECAGGNCGEDADPVAAEHVTLLEKAADPEHKQDYRNTMVTIGGSGFDWHDVESYFRPNAIGSYSFDDNNNIVFNKRNKLFDVAVMLKW